MRRPSHSALVVSALAAASGCGLFLGTDDLAFDGTTGQGATGGTNTNTSTGTNAQGTGGSSTTSNTSTGTTTSSGGGETTAAGGSNGGLIETGLLARYFLDEAASGTPPVNALDSAPAPLDLSLRYDDNCSYTEVNGNRGLQWLVADYNGDAFADISETSTKLWLLQGSPQVTIEVVLDIDVVGLAGSPIVFIGDTQTINGYFGLYANDASTLSVVMGANGGTFNVALPSLNRVVIHGVLDVQGAGLVLYVNGTPATAVATTPAAVDLATSSHILLGNNRDYSSSPKGIIFYTALYSEALESDEVSHNAQLLLADDDTQ